MHPSSSSPVSPNVSSKNISHPEENHRQPSPQYDTRDAKPPTSPHTDPAPLPKINEGEHTEDFKPNINAQPLAPPPRPAQHNPSDTPGEYFGSGHNHHLYSEPNPFEQSFGKGSSEIPSHNLLPSVHTLASPAPLLAGGTPGGWGPNSLRSGPLSPAMLPGPTGPSDYFAEHHFSRGLITPNESSLRTGLTPGGGGSMFPAPSPNSQALFQSLQSGGATPGTLDFHRTAMHAAAQQKQEYNQRLNGQSSQAAEQSGRLGVDQKPYQPPQPQQGHHDPFGSNHDANDAANGLFMLSHGNHAQNRNNQFAMPTSAPSQGMMNNMSHQMPTAPMAGQPRNASPRRGGKGSVSSIPGMSEGGEFSESGGSDQAKPQTRSRGKKGSNSKGGQAANGRRKAEETPSRQPANKKSKGNSGNVNQMLDMDAMGDDSDDGSVKQETDELGRKMTDEEKRKNFLERNRVAALKCRQRKKQWLANLQTKVEIFSTENDALSAQVTQLREEIVNLKTLLLAHKECPVSQAQGLNGMAMNSFAQDLSHHANPYGMGMVNGGQQMQMQGMRQG